MTQDDLKIRAAEAAVKLVKSGMVVGLGAGSTALKAIELIGENLKNGILNDIKGIPASVQVENDAKRVGIPLTTFSAHPTIEITIDGADEVDASLTLIKGGGGALLREKVLAQSSQSEIIIVDESKVSPVVGTTWPVPCEVIPFALGAVLRELRRLGAEPIQRTLKNGDPFRTDQGNYIVDAKFGPIHQPGELSRSLDAIAGIVEHGLFVNLATQIIVAGNEGIRHIEK